MPAVPQKICRTAVIFIIHDSAGIVNRKFRHFLQIQKGAAAITATAPFLFTEIVSENDFDYAFRSEVSGRALMMCTRNFSSAVASLPSISPF